MKRNLLRIVLPLVAAGALTIPAGATDASDVMAMTRAQRAELTSLTLTGQVTPEVLTVIRDEMYKLQSLSLAGTDMTEIPAHAFAGKSVLVRVSLPDGLRSIGDGAFSECRSLRSIDIPAGVTTIGAQAFARTGLRSLAIGQAVTSIGADALFFCPSLTTITVAAGNTAYTVIDGTLYSADKTTLIKRPAGATGTPAIAPETKVIAPHAFDGCFTMGMPQLPAGLTTIGDFAFSGCKSMAGPLVIPASVTSIGKGAFLGCTSISDTLHVSVPLTASYTYAYLTGVKTIELPAGIESIPASSFELCSGVTTIKSPVATPPAVGDMALRGINRSTTFVDVPEGAVNSYVAAPVWNEFENYDGEAPTYTFFSTNGNYRIKYVGPGPANGKYIAFSNADNTAALMVDGADAASVWTLDFFTVNYAALPYNGEQGSDILFIDGDRCKHINMAGMCWNDAAAGYTNNANRTFAFYTTGEGEPVAIRGNGTLWGVNADGTRLAAPSFSASLPSRNSFVWELERADASEPEDPFSYSIFSTDGEYRIKYVGDGPAKDKYIAFSADNTAANLVEGVDAASAWTLEFFTVNYAALPFNGEKGSDILFVDGDRCKHINKAGVCYNDPLAGYNNNVNRTFAFYMASDGKRVAIRANGTLFGANAAGTQLAAPAFTAAALTEPDFVWALESTDPSGIEDVAAGSDAFVPVAVYTLTGARVTGTPAHGIYIMVGADGRVVKARL